MIAKPRKRVLVDDILKEVGEFEILAHYLNITSIPAMIYSPFRDEKKPSLSLYSTDGFKIKYKDFGNGESGGTFDLLSKIWSTSFRDTISKIDSEKDQIKKIYKPKTIKLEKKEGIYSKMTPKKMIISSDVDLKVKIRDWRDYDLEYWESFGISKDWLEFGRVYPISHIFTKVKDEPFYIIPADKYAYVYVEFKDGIESIKIYQPYSDKFKWRNKHDGSVWDLWDQLPDQGDKLIITSSRKDALTLWENTGIPSVSLQSETYIPKKHIVEQLKKRFKNIYVLYDNDYYKEKNTGRINGKRFAKEFNLKQIEIPSKAEAKDPSDLVMKWGRKALITLINRLVND